MDAVSGSNHRMMGMHPADHGTVVGAAQRTERKGAQPCCVRGMCNMRAQRCTMNMKGARHVEMRCVWIHVLDQQVEEHNRLCSGVRDTGGGRNRSD